MSYAVVSDVQGRIATQLLTIGASSQPTTDQVEEWLEQQSAWIDNTIRWRYAVPITNEDDVKLLRPICAALVAAMCWQVIGSHGGELPSPAKELRDEALQSLSYDRYVVSNSGRSMIVLPNSTLSDSGEAGLAAPEGSFTDPDSDTDDVNPRFFEIGMDF